MLKPLTQEFIEKSNNRFTSGTPVEFILRDALEESITETSTRAELFGLYESLRHQLSNTDNLISPFDHLNSFYPNKKVFEENRCYHGDCRDILPLCKAHKPVGVITDYPYGMDFQSNMRTATSKFNKILNDDKPFIDTWIKQCYKILPTDAFFITFYRWDLQDELFDEILSAGFKIKSQLVWVKGGGGMGDVEGSWAEEHENAVFAVKGNWKFPAGVGRPSATLKCPKIGGGVIHPNEKPALLYQGLIRNTTNKGDLIIEPFSGSGACLEASVKEGRRCIAMELDNRPVEALGGKNYIQHANERAQAGAAKSSTLF